MTVSTVMTEYSSYAAVWMRPSGHRAWWRQLTTPQQQDTHTKIQIFYNYLVLDITEDFSAIVSCDLPFYIRVSKSLNSFLPAFFSLQSGFANTAPSWLHLHHLKEQTSDNWRHDKLWLLPTFHIMSPLPKTSSNTVHPRGLLKACASCPEPELDRTLSEGKPSQSLTGYCIYQHFCCQLLILGSLLFILIKSLS